MKAQKRGREINVKRRKSKCKDKCGGRVFRAPEYYHEHSKINRSTDTLNRRDGTRKWKKK
jgi:hypothetical protein